MPRNVQKTLRALTWTIKDEVMRRGRVLRQTREGTRDLIAPRLVSPLTPVGVPRRKESEYCRRTPAPS